MTLNMNCNAFASNHISERLREGGKNEVKEAELKVEKTLKDMRRYYDFERFDIDYL